MIDSRPFGGTCALRGCDPKKVLVGAADVIDAAERFADRGIPVGARIVWPDLVRFKRHIIADERTVSEPRPPAVSNCLRWGGCISFEFAQVAVHAGVHATILHRGERPLNAFDPDLVALLVERSHALGIDVRLSTNMRTITKTGDRFIVHAETRSDAVQVESSMVVHGAGRVPEIDDLSLDAAGVAWRTDGVIINECLQSVSNPVVYAAGDAAASGAPRLAPVAAHHGHIVAANLLDETHRRNPDHTVVPSVVFTTPPLAAVGPRENAARERELQFETHDENTSSWFSSRRVGETHSDKVLIEKSSQRILGAHALGPHADEVINVFAVAMRAGLRTSEIKKMMLAYPTSGFDVVYMV